MLCYAASELALTALISSDELESLSLPREAQLLQREAAVLRCDYTEGSAEICLLFDHDLAISGVYVK